MRAASGLRGALKPQARTSIGAHQTICGGVGLYRDKSRRVTPGCDCASRIGDFGRSQSSLSTSLSTAASLTTSPGSRISRNASSSVRQTQKIISSPAALRTTSSTAKHVSTTYPALARAYSMFTRAPPQRSTHVGHSTASEHEVQALTNLPFYFETGYALFAKRRSKPFPPPFLSLPSGSFSEPLSTFDRSQDRRPHVNSEPIRGVTNGDDAVVAEPYFVGANDGVGQWATRPRGHAALWSRLILHFWSREVEHALSHDPSIKPDPIAFLQTAYESTCEATHAPEWHGTTTACSALLHSYMSESGEATPSLYVTNLGDSQVLVLRPETREVLYKTAEQWHWFDCPRQLGTNSQDTPRDNAVCEAVPVREGDIVLAMSDGVPDNLWEHEITANVFNSVEKLQKESEERTDAARAQDTPGSGMMWVAEELVKATRVIAEDPFAESPYMERAIEEGLAIEGGKMDDISVVVARCTKRKS